MVMKTAVGDSNMPTPSASSKDIPSNLTWLVVLATHVHHNKQVSIKTKVVTPVLYGSTGQSSPFLWKYLLCHIIALSLSHINLNLDIIFTLTCCAVGCVCSIAL